MTVPPRKRRQFHLQKCPNVPMCVWYSSTTESTIRENKPMRILLLGREVLALWKLFQIASLALKSESPLLHHLDLDHTGRSG